MATRTGRSPEVKSIDWQRLRLEGRTFCLAGTFQWCDRTQATDLIAAEGGQVVKSVTGKLDYLIVGQKPGGRTSSAKQKADKLNQSGKAAIQVLDESGFHHLFVPDNEIAIAMLKAGPAGIVRWNATLGNNWLRIGIDLRRTDFRNCDLGNADLRKADLSGCDFRGATFDGAAFEVVHAAQFDESTGAVQIQRAERCSFTNAELSQVPQQNKCAIYARHSNCDGVRFRNGGRHKLVNCSAKRADLSRFSLKYMEAPGTIFDRSDLQDAELEHSEFAGASLRKCDLSRARLESGNFSGADLTGAKCVDADMSSCNLTNANLSKTNLRGAQLSNADFSGAVLDGADLTGANILGATLTPEQMNSAKGVRPETMPPVQVGPNITELEKAASQSERLSVKIRIDIDEGQFVSLSVETWGSPVAYGQHTVHNIRNDEVEKKYANLHRISDCMLELANRWNRGTPRFDSVKVSASKSPLKRKELQMLAVAAWCEAFGLDVVTESELKELKMAAAGDAERLRDQALADLRTAGVGKWNQLADNQRASLGRMRRLDLTGLDLQSGKFDDLDLQGTDFSGANLKMARFDNADLKKATLDHVNGAGAWFPGIKANDASFKNTDLSGSHIREASLLRTDFSGAKLEKADFKSSDVRGANFAGADLNGATFEGARFDEKTVFPDGFELPEQLIWTGEGEDPRLRRKLSQVQSAGPLDFKTFMEQLEENVDSARLGKALDMLRVDSFQLFAEVEEGSLTGVVKSQTDADLVYSCRLDAGGTFACCTQNLNPCGGLRGALCKHLLVLIVGLTKVEELDPTTVNGWVAASKLQAPKLDKDLMSEVFLKYKGAEAGEIDWRPTETVPEDYYAF